MKWRVEGGGGGGGGLKNPLLGLNRDNNNNGTTTMLFYSTKRISGLYLKCVLDAPSLLSRQFVPI